MLTTKQDTSLPKRQRSPCTPSDTAATCERRSCSIPTPLCVLKDNIGFTGGSQASLERSSSETSPYPHSDTEPRQKTLAHVGQTSHQNRHPNFHRFRPAYSPGYPVCWNQRGEESEKRIEYRERDRCGGKLDCAAIVADASHHVRINSPLTPESNFGIERNRPQMRVPVPLPPPRSNA